MTVLSAAQSAAIRLLGVKPSGLYSSAEQFEMELADLAIDVACEIADAYDWQALTEFGTINGNSTDIAFNLPSDFRRMPLDGEIHSKDWQTINYTPARDKDEWIWIQDTGMNGMPGKWIILKNKLQFFPIMPTGEKARFYYISKNIVGGTKPAFTQDSDTFVLSERLLTLGLIWRWRAQKRMEYAEDLETYERLLEKEIAFDKGRRILTVGKRRTTMAMPAFPGVIQP